MPYKDEGTLLASSHLYTLENIQAAMLLLNHLVLENIIPLSRYTFGQPDIDGKIRFPYLKG